MADKPRLRDMTDAELDEAIRTMVVSVAHIEWYSKRTYAKMCDFLERLQREQSRRKDKAKN